MKHVGKISPIRFIKNTEGWQEKKLLENYREMKEANKMKQKGP